MAKYDPSPTVAAGIVRLARIKAGITQTELARRAGITQQAISEYETGRTEPTLPTLLKLVGAAGYELRMQLEPADGHDLSIEEYLAALSPDLRAKAESHQRNRVDEARLRRIRGN